MGGSIAQQLILDGGGGSLLLVRQPEEVFHISLNTSFPEYAVDVGGGEGNYALKISDQKQPAAKHE